LTSPVSTIRPPVDLGDLDGPAGNAFAVLARCRLAACQAGWTPSQVTAFTTEASQGDYEHLLETVRRRFCVIDPETPRPLLHLDSLTALKVGLDAGEERS
jgi:hypothetical protein